MVTITLGVMTTTAQQIDGRPVREYVGLVSSESLALVRHSRHRGADGESELQHGQRHVVEHLARCASARGATAVIGIVINYVAMGPGRVLVSATGTAVRL